LQSPDEVSRVAAALDWLGVAAADCRATELLLAAPDPPRAIVAFHAQQYVEKLLKAVLALRGEDPPRTHSLRDLALRVTSEDVPDEILSAAQALDPFAVLGRYPGLALEPDTERLAGLVAHVRRLEEWTRSCAGSDSDEVIAAWPAGLAAEGEAAGEEDADPADDE